MGAQPLTNIFFYPLEIIHSKKKATEQKKRVNYYPFGLEHKGYNNIVSSNGNSTAQKFGYNGMEHQEELGLNMYDYGARNYDPAIARWWQIDPLAEQMRRFSPYNFAWNNPVYFIDPDGMFAEPFTELFDTKGKKIGEDANGNDGNVSIVSKDVAKSVKKGDVSVDDAIAGGVQTTKTVLAETIDVLQRTEDNGGLQEEASVVTADNKVVKGERGSADVVNIDGVDAITTPIPDAPTEGSTLIHSHQTAIGKDANGGPTAGNAEEPGPNDPSIFSDYKQSIIVGRLGKTTGNSDGTFNQPSLGAAFFSNKTTINSSPVLTLKKRSIKKIIKNKK